MLLMTIDELKEKAASFYSFYHLDDLCGDGTLVQDLEGQNILCLCIDISTSYPHVTHDNR